MDKNPVCQHTWVDKLALSCLLFFLGPPELPWAVSLITPMLLLWRASLWQGWQPGYLVINKYQENQNWPMGKIGFFFSFFFYHVLGFVKNKKLSLQWAPSCMSFHGNHVKGVSTVWWVSSTHSISCHMSAYPLQRRSLYFISFANFHIIMDFTLN